jgi:hypothetical protein
MKSGPAGGSLCHGPFSRFAIGRLSGFWRVALVEEELRIRPQDLDRLLEWMRRSGRPRTTEELLRFWLERLRDEATRGR